MEWIRSNMGTIAVGMILVTLVVAIVRNLIKQHKTGTASCGCGCSGCAMSGMCHAHHQVKVRES